MSTQVYERIEGESAEDWRLRAADALSALTDAFEDGKGDPSRMVITVVKGERDGYSVTVTVTRVDKDTEEA